MTKTFLAASLATALLGGCLTEDETTLGSTEGESYEAWKAQLGREPGTGYYIVDWDVVISDETRLYEHWQESQSGQALSIYRINGVDIKWSDAQKVNLTYCFGSTFSAANRTAVQAAMNGATVQGWEKFANIKFVHVPAQDGAGCTAANQNVVFDVNQVNSGGQYLARAFFPNSPRAERNVLVDTTAFGNLGNITLTNIMIHELGHALGFRHEHIARPGQATQGCVEDQNYRVIDGVYDQTSTMHYPQCGSPNNTLALSPRDQSGVATIYGAPLTNMAPVASVAQPANNSTVGPNFMVSAMVSDGNNNLTKVELFIDGTLYGAPLTTSPFIFQVSNLSLGPHQLTVKATDASGEVTTTSVTNVTVSANGGDGSGNGTGTGTGTEEPSQDVTGGCNTGGGSASILFGLGLLGLAIRRRR